MSVFVEISIEKKNWLENYQHSHSSHKKLSTK